MPGPLRDPSPGARARVRQGLDSADDGVTAPDAVDRAPADSAPDDPASGPDVDADEGTWQQAERTDDASAP